MYQHKKFQYMTTTTLQESEVSSVYAFKELFILKRFPKP